MNKSIYERVLDLRNRISLDGDNTIYEEDYLLLDEVLDHIEKMNNSNYDEYLIVDIKKNRGIQKKYKFENGRGASVVRYPYSRGGNVGLYELAVLDKYGYIDYTTPITNKVIGWLTWEEVIELLRKIKELEK